MTICQPPVVREECALLIWRKEKSLLVIALVTTIVSNAVVICMKVMAVSTNTVQLLSKL